MPTRKIRYVGPEDARQLPDGQIVERGHQVEVESDLARSLLDQADVFVAVKDPVRVKAAKKAAATRAEAEATDEGDAAEAEPVSEE